MSFSLDVNENDLKEAIDLLERTGANMEKAVPRIVSDTATLAFRQAKKITEDEDIRRTGLYSRSMRMRMEGSGVDQVGIVGNAAVDPKSGFPYPIVIEKGSRPHMITPTVKKCLHFMTKAGDEVFTQRVMHPGTKPRNVFKRAVSFATKEIPRLVRGALEKMGKL